MKSTVTLSIGVALLGLLLWFAWILLAVPEAPDELAAPPVTSEPAMAAQAPVEALPAHDDRAVPDIQRTEAAPDDRPRDAERAPAAVSGGLELVVPVLPDTGFVEVTVLSEDSTPLTGGVEIELGVVAEGEPRRLSAFEAVQRPTVSRRLDGDRVRFSLVETGTELEIAVQREESKAVTRIYGPGPASAGETASFEVQLGSDHPVLAFRAVDGRGNPLALVDLHGRVKILTRSVFSHSNVLATTDAGGNALLDLDGGWTRGTRRTLLLAVGTFLDPELRTQLDLSYLLQPGINELGDLVFQPELPLFAAGRVVTTAGAPVPGARISLLSRSGADEGWERCLSPRIQAGADGRFELIEAPPGEEFRIGAAHPGLDGPPLDFTPGDRDLVIVLEAEGAIAGDVLVDPEVPKKDVWIGITDFPEGLDSRGFTSRTAIVGESGAFRLGPLAPGTYEVSVGTRHEGGDVLTVPDVIVHGGETTRDARLAGIDLRGALHVHRVCLRSPEPTDLPLNGGFRYRLPGSAEWSSTARFMTDEFLFVAPHERIDLEVFAARHRSIRLEDVAGEIEVTLRAGLPVRLLLRGDAPVPDAPLFVRAQLVPRGTGNSGGADRWGPVFDQRREILVTAPGPGEMEVLWFVERRLETSSHSGRGRFAGTRYVEVQDAEGVQTVELTVSAEEMEAILGAMR